MRPCVSDADRTMFAEQVERPDGYWISQEVMDVLPGVAARLRQRPPAHTTTYTLALDQLPVAFTAFHGGWLRWLATPTPPNPVLLARRTA
jgi:hypothetical protein